MESVVSPAVMIQGDAEPRSRKKRLLSIECNPADNSYKSVEMDEYKQEINDKIAILRLELWKSKNYQVNAIMYTITDVVSSLTHLRPCNRRLVIFLCCQKRSSWLMLT